MIVRCSLSDDNMLSCYISADVNNKMGNLMKLFLAVVVVVANIIDIVLYSNGLVLLEVQCFSCLADLLIYKKIVIDSTYVFWSWL